MPILREGRSVHLASRNVGMRPIALVVREEVPIQSIEHDDDRFHKGMLLRLER